MDNVVKTEASVGEYGRKVFVTHYRTEGFVYDFMKVLGNAYFKHHSCDDESVRQFRDPIYRAIDNVLCKHDDVVAITVVVDLQSGEWAWSVCREPDQFNKKYGRLLALNRLAEKLGPKRRVYRLFSEGVLYLVPVGETCFGPGVISNTLDIRYELNRIKGRG